MHELTLHFVRHGESLANEADKAGRPRPADWDGLSARGWEQARGLGRRLADAGIEVIVASTMRRAQETAQGINEVLGLDVSANMLARARETTSDPAITYRQADLETLDGSQLLAGTAASDIGIGVAQGKHPDIGDNAIWIVVMFGERHAP